MESSIVLKSYGRLYNPTGNWGYYPHYLANRFYYICSGTVHFKDKLQLKPGFIYLFKSDSEFKVSQSDSDPIDHVYFDFISSGQMIDKEYVEIDPDKYPRLKSILAALSHDYSLNEYPMHLAEAYFDIIYYELQEYFIANRKYSELTTKIFRDIHECPPADLTVAGIAESLNINVNHLIRTFKRDTGITPLKYIGMMKSELAINYARKGYSLDDIADMLGYSTVSALSVAFKNTTNKNLSEFR